MFQHLSAGGDFLLAIAILNLVVGCYHSLNRRWAQAIHYDLLGLLLVSAAVMQEILDRLPEP